MQMNKAEDLMREAEHNRRYSVKNLPSCNFETLYQKAFCQVKSSRNPPKHQYVDFVSRRVSVIQNPKLLTSYQNTKQKSIKAANKRVGERKVSLDNCLHLQGGKNKIPHLRTSQESPHQNSNAFDEQGESKKYWKKRNSPRLITNPALQKRIMMRTGIKINPNDRSPGQRCSPQTNDKRQQILPMIIQTNFTTKKITQKKKTARLKTIKCYPQPHVTPIEIKWQDQVEGWEEIKPKQTFFDHQQLSYGFCQ